MFSIEEIERAYINILGYIEKDLCEDCMNRLREIHALENATLCAFHEECENSAELCIEWIDDSIAYRWNRMLLFDIASRVVDMHDTSDWGEWRKFIYARDMMKQMLKEKWYGVRIGTQL